MKKVLCLIAVLVCLLCGCSNGVSADKYTPVLNGKAVDMPLPVTIDDLGSDYSLVLGVALMYKGNAALGVKFEDGYEETDELKRPINSFVRSYANDTKKTSFSIGGIELGDNRQEVLDVYGEPSYKDEELNIWKYCKLGRPEDQYWLGFQFGHPSDPDKVTSIYFRFQ